MTKKDLHNKTLGFTLIELSIVLVVIGLIVGGIFVGADMLNAAQVRATVGQEEKYQSAIKTFQTKYKDLPGDISAVKATQFGLFSEAAGLGFTVGHEDQNGLIEGGSAGATIALGETIDFWEHLYAGGLIDSAMGIIGNSQIVVATGALSGLVTKISQTLPPTKTTPPNYFTVYAASGLNYLQIVPVSQIPVSGVYTFGTVGLTPVQAFSMDIKLDDGNPLTGIVQADAITGVLNALPSTNAAPTNNTCVLGTGVSTDTYNRTAGLGASDGSCSLEFRFN